MGENKSLRNADIEDFLLFVQTVTYGGTIYQSSVITRVSINDNQKTKSSMELTPDPDFAIQVILRVHCQCYYCVHCLQEEKPPILI